MISNSLVEVLLIAYFIGESVLMVRLKILWPWWTSLKRGTFVESSFSRCVRLKINCKLDIIGIAGKAAQFEELRREWMISVKSGELMDSGVWSFKTQ